MGDSGNRQSTSNAVWGRRLYKTYGKGKNKANALAGLNLNVPYGAIYGLLGPSGCGKTTLLRCIVGLLKVDSGSLLAMGDVPGARDHSIPGPMVGYMPQDTSLYNELSIKELLLYYGRVHGMTSEDIVYRTSFLLDFLKLPTRDQLIGCLRIWEHLLEIAQSSQQTTIIITTHYIEEARQADRVGLMRAGRMLDEDKPSNLLDRYNMVSLESIFLYLCHHDLVGNAEDEELMSGQFALESTMSEDSAVNYDASKPLIATESADAGGSNSSIYGTVTFENIPRGRPPPDPCCVFPSLPAFRVIMALVIKNLTIMKRSIGLLFFEFIIPSIQIILFCLCIGRDPHDIKLAVVNNDLGPMGATYLKFLSNTTFKQVLFNSLDHARDSVHQGDAWGVVEIRPEFSEDLMQRFLMGINVSTKVITGSTVYLHLDYTSQQISAVIHARTLESFQNFSRSTLALYGFNTHYSDPPVLTTDPVYGSADSIFTEFMAPGICNSITFFMATGLTTLAFVLEKKEGNYERNLVNGVTPAEVMLSHVITQFLVLLVQVGLLLLCTFTIFQIPLEGNPAAVLFLILIEGLCGMCLGIMISCCCDKETSAMQLSLGLVYPLLLTSGIIWPIQAVPAWLEYISEALPLTIATDALRSIMGRGWGIDHMFVWLGFVISIGWAMFFLMVTAVIGRIKR
ncbi:hypothetical protein BaRGS_00008887 [Batillaria attramentaria]|uniref:ABC transporter domain-containing protein n=1 Tax=Batillaria attramentaria TaxID=370345 RepID=A0ABD0LJV7_9CAEN